MSALNKYGAGGWTPIQKKLNYLASLLGIDENPIALSPNEEVNV